MHTPSLGPSDSNRSISHVSASSLQWQRGFAAYLMPEGTLSTSSVKLKHMSVSEAFSSIKNHLVRAFHICCLIPVRPEVRTSTRMGLAEQMDVCDVLSQAKKRASKHLESKMKFLLVFGISVCSIHNVHNMILVKFLHIIAKIKKK